jgi:hypothetical protein
VSVVTGEDVSPVRIGVCGCEACEEEGREGETRWVWMRESRRPQSLHESGIGKKEPETSHLFSGFPFPVTSPHHPYSQVTVHLVRSCQRDVQEESVSVDRLIWDWPLYFSARSWKEGERRGKGG